MFSLKNLPRNKGGLYILLIAAVVLETTAVLQYYYSEHIISTASKLIVQAELRNIDIQVDNIADSADNVQIEYIIECMKQYPNCAYTLTGADGLPLLPAPDTIAGDKYHTFKEEVGTKGWILSVLIPDSDLYGRLRVMGSIVTILMLLGLALLVFIIYRSAKNIVNLINVEESKQRIENELSIARNIQMSMLPKTFPPYPNREDLNMYGIIIPAKEVGGDLYDFYVRDEKLLFCIGDVSGKGVPASLVMAVTRSLFRTVSAHENDAAKIVYNMNNAMSEMNEQNMFVTFFLGVFDLKNGQLNYCNAGHNEPLKIEKDKNEINNNTTEKASESDEHRACNVQLSTVSNIPLGILSGYNFEAQQTTLHAGDCLFLYTDGLTEAENADKKLFGEERMIKTARSWNEENTSRYRVEMMQNEVQNFVGDAEQSDDLTMLSIIWTPQVSENKKSEVHSSSTYHLTMRNDIRTIPTLAEWVDTLPIPNELNMTINLALEEAVSNVMLYAYPKGQAGIVELTAEVNNNPQCPTLNSQLSTKITFTIEDSGKPFDPTIQAEPDITLAVEERPIGGLGIHLVRQIMDDIHYERKNDRNILILVKNI